MEEKDTSSKAQEEFRRFIRGELHAELGCFLEMMHAELRTLKEDSFEKELRALGQQMRKDMSTLGDQVQAHFERQRTATFYNSTSKGSVERQMSRGTTERGKAGNGPTMDRPISAQPQPDNVASLTPVMPVQADVTSTPIEPFNAPKGGNLVKVVPSDDAELASDMDRRTLELAAWMDELDPLERPISEKEEEENGKEADSERGVSKAGLFAFADVDNIKQKVRAQKMRTTSYDVRDMYHSQGIFQTIARHRLFENTTLVVIVANALWISVDTDGNDADTLLDAKPLYVVADCLFFGYFFFEWFFRFMAFQKKVNCCRDAWFVFDTALVTLYLCDPFLIALITYLKGGGGLNLPTAMLRLFRLARLSRIIRMLRSLPELMVMIKGMVSATASVGYTLGLLLCITYVFAIALRNIVPKDSFIEEEFLSTVPESMHNLIIYATFLDDLSYFILAVKQDSSVCLIMVWTYIAMASLTVMNMLIGVLCEVISAVATEEKEGLMIDSVKEQFHKIYDGLDQNKDGSISWKEFQHIMEVPQVLRTLASVNVDPEILIDMAEDFFWDQGVEIKMKFGDFMNLILDVRGGQVATVKDVMGVGKRFNAKMASIRTQTDSIDAKVSDLKRTFTDQSLKLQHMVKEDFLLRNGTSSALLSRSSVLSRSSLSGAVAPNPGSA